MARSNQSGRVKVEGIVGGLNTLVDPLVGDLRQSPDLANVRVESGLLAQRKGGDCLDREPSSINAAFSAKGRVSLTFSAASSEYGTATVGLMYLGTKWTIRLEMAFAQASHQAAASFWLFRLTDAVTHPLELYVEGNGTAMRLVCKVTADATVTLTTAFKTAATWAADISGRFIRIERNGGTVNLYVGETLEATDSTTTGAHVAALTLYLNADSTPANQSNSVFYGLTIFNRILTEEEVYWGASYPGDPMPEDVQILGNWPSIEGSGTSLKDYSIYANNITLFNTPTWSSGTNRFARGLGVFNHRLRDGTKYHVLGASRTAPDAAGNAPSGAIYIWEATRDFQPFYFGGQAAQNDGSASLDELDFLARHDFINFKDILLWSNGVDFMRHWASSVWGYLGGTAPHVMPVVAITAGASNWKYVQTWYNPTTKKETGASPIADATAATAGTTVRAWTSTDPQFSRARIYRITTGGTVFYLAGEVNAGALFTDTIPDADLQKQALLPGPDGSFSGNQLVKRSYIPGGPATAPTVAVGAGGNVNAGIHYYAYDWYNSVTGASSGFSPLSAAVNPGVASIINLTNIRSPVASGTFDQFRVWSTKAGAFEWFLVAAVTPAGYSTINETYNANTADSGLTTTLETLGLPPKAAFKVPFASRVFYGGDPAAKGTGWWSAPGFGEDITWTAGHDTNPGAELVAMHATTFNLFWHYSDGRIFVMDHPGPDPALEQFVPFNIRLWADHGAAMSQRSIQYTPLGVIWLGRDGFYRQAPEGPQNIAPTITETFLDLNIPRARFACSLYDRGRQVYRCWLSRGNDRYNEDCFVLDLRNLVWCVDDWPHGDAAGVLLDGKETPHYVVMGENGVLVELTDDDQDGDGSGTLSGAVAGATIVSFTDIAGRVAPTGEDSGYPIYFKNDSTGVIYQRHVISPGLGLVSAKVNFYPSLVALLTGSWTVYFHGIRGRWKSMMLDYGDRRYDKSLGDFFLYHGEESAATTLAITAAAAGGTLAAIGTMTLNQGDNRGVIEHVALAGRVFQVEVDHNPPVAGRTFRIMGMEFGSKLAGDSDS